MSRGFVKEDDSQAPPIIPPRAALPPNTPNYVTPRGLEQLREELTALETARSQAEADRANDTDRARQLGLLNGQLSQLTARIASARVVDPRQQPADEVRFGATVVLRSAGGAPPAGNQKAASAKPAPERRFTIVGVDEASVAEGKVAFVAPIARAVLGAKLGQQVTLRLGPKEETVEVAGISYDGG